ncbi:hypothetical protein UB23_20565 [Pseudomonas sp. ES3-33]|nr:hypothetical protein UB23_20565 [Pseudomonas sp. ES3-33]
MSGKIPVDLLPISLNANQPVTFEILRLGGHTMGFEIGGAGAYDRTNVANRPCYQRGTGQISDQHRNVKPLLVHVRKTIMIMGEYCDFGIKPHVIRKQRRHYIAAEKEWKQYSQITLSLNMKAFS